MQQQRQRGQGNADGQLNDGLFDLSTVSDRCPAALKLRRIERPAAANSTHSPRSAANVCHLVLPSFFEQSTMMAQSLPGAVGHLQHTFLRAVWWPSMRCSLAPVLRQRTRCSRAELADVQPASSEHAQRGKFETRPLQDLATPCTCTVDYLTSLTVSSCIACMPNCCTASASA